MTPVSGGGYYSEERRKAYVYIQPSEYYTRQLVLHEATPLAAGKATIDVKTFDTLLIHFAQQVGASMIVRGNRSRTTSRTGRL